MERILSAEQMRRADKFTIENLGVPEEVLVERAGGAVSDVIKKRFQGGRVLVCVGKGNNGADGRVIANNLSNTHGFSVVCVDVNEQLLNVFDKKFDIIVDCIFGTGLNRNVEGVYKQFIQRINESGAFVVACDIPSGLNGNNGKVLGVAVKSNLTVAVQEYKLGHFLNDGPDYSGEIVCKDIGISVWEDDCVKKLTDKSASKLFGQRKKNSHKGSYGSACVIGGSKEYTGSVLLSATALTCFKMGVGYSALAIPESLFSAYVGKVPECLLFTFSENGTFDEKTTQKILNFDSISIGMGMGVNESVYGVIKFLVNNFNGTLIIDADGLNSISKFGLDIFVNKKANIIITPHVGEFSRLTGLTKEEILSNPTKLAYDFAKKHGIIVVLKSSASVITDGKEIYLNTTGCSGLAKAGSGDVLSGIIAGLTARCEDKFFASIVACYVFGKTAEMVEKEQNAFTMTATDVINALPKAINGLN